MMYIYLGIDDLLDLFRGLTIEPNRWGGMFDGILGVIITIGCVTDDRLRDSPPPGNRKHNTSVVFDC